MTTSKSSDDIQAGSAPVESLVRLRSTDRREATTEAFEIAASKCHEQQNDPWEWRRFEGTIPSDPRELWNQAVCECHDVIMEELRKILESGAI